MTLQPGLRPQRLLTLIERSLATMDLDLSGSHVVTEAATGAYVVTPVIAALAGADVTAVTRATRFGSVQDVVDGTFALAELAGVSERITIVDELTKEIVDSADVVTNSGHVRPIDRTRIGWMRPSCVVPLMFESWEIDVGRVDVDLEALRERGVRFAGTNERHPAVGVFSYLGSMAVKLLIDAQVAVHDSTLLLVCDNPFMHYLEDGLVRAGARVIPRASLDPVDLGVDLDGVVVALTPRDTPVLSPTDLDAVAQRAPGAVIAQFWGDVQRDECERRGLACVPTIDPGRGHMGVLPSAVGPEPIVRLQAGGLKVASILRRPEMTWTDDDRSYVDEC